METHDTFALDVTRSNKRCAAGEKYGRACRRQKESGRPGKLPTGSSPIWERTVHAARISSLLPSAGAGLFLNEHVLDKYKY
jgi:hypothetical protein